MTPDQLFSIANLVSVAGWIALAVLPGRRWVTDVLCRFLLPAVFGAAYVVIVVAQFAGSDGDFSTLAGVATLFRNPWLLLAGWLHYLAFDLFVGSWEARDARARAIPHLLLVPCLALTLFFGPAGLLLYLAIRSARAPAATASRSSPVSSPGVARPRS
jgi:hypothetical protein